MILLFKLIEWCSFERFLYKLINSWNKIFQVSIAIHEYVRTVQYFVKQIPVTVLVHGFVHDRHN